MDKQNTNTSSPRLLLNAEPFGFGPSAAIAALFPHLRAHFNDIAYVGRNHTLDLQTSLPYDRIYDVSEYEKEDREQGLAPIFENYDIMLSAMDCEMVDLAQKAGLKVFYYDALAWYWPSIPDEVQKADLYIAQDFFGVQERLTSVFGANMPHVHKIPPIVSVPDAAALGDKKHILINLGGLQNPFWPVDEIADFVKSTLQALKHVIPQNENIIIACSKAVAERLNDPQIQTFPRDEMEKILAQSKMAFMTPGLGNIYDAAAYNIPTIWLPPANDSQGQQLKSLRSHAMMDAALDWHDFTPSSEVDYSAAQSDVLHRISELARELPQNILWCDQFKAAAAKAYDDICGMDKSRTRLLLNQFGTGGEKHMADLTIKTAKRLYPAMQGGG